MDNKDDLGSLLGYKALGDFKVQTDDGNKAVLSHDPIQTNGLPLPWQYGGDIAANVILAASTRLPRDSKLSPMSVHIEYVSPGDVTKERNYHVDKIRQSDRFMHTMVTIRQKEIVAIATVTFHSYEHTANSLSFLPEFPADCPPPHELKDQHELLKQFADAHDQEHLSEGRRMVEISHGLGLCARPVSPALYFRLNREPTTRLTFWARYRDSEIAKMFTDIESTTWSAALLAYASDFRIMSPSVRQNPSFQVGRMTTMSHGIWFAPDTNVQLKSPTEWFLYDVRVVMSGNNTVLCEGNIWNEKKELLASAKQQGLVRPKNK